MTRVTRVAALARIALSLALGASCAGKDSASRDAAFRPLAVGETVRPLAVPTLVGDTVQVGGTGGVTVLNVWATWCTSCRDEMADLNALHDEFAARGVRVLAVSVDADDGSRVRRFAREERLTLTVAHDPERRVERVYQVVGVPETFLIGAEGRLVWRHIGNVHPVIDSLRAVVRGAVGGPERR